MKLAVRGRAFSGKTTFAQYMHDVQGYTIINYTDILKMLAAQALQAVGVDATVRSIKANKEVERGFLIALGHRIGFDQGEYVDYALTHAGNPTHVVFDNVRYIEQWQKLERVGYTLVTLGVGNGLQEQRAKAAGRSLTDLEALRMDPTEQLGWSVLNEIVVDIGDDESTPAALYDEIRQAFFARRTRALSLGR